ncbi:DUF3089 domain-containing protein [soil metagenome]
MIRIVKTALAAASGAGLLTLAAAPAFAQAPASQAPAAVAQPKNDYAQGANWLYRPDRLCPCGSDLTTTAIAPDGKTTREAYRAARDPKIDCFYVYPTVSHDLMPNSDMIPGPEENSVVLTQFARLGAKCRLFAPMYRQVTLTALQAGILGKPMAVDRTLGVNDVRDAWNYYLEHDNHGRGVVLVGHSQGSGVLTQLIKTDIDGKPVQAKVISALLLGTSLQVPEGKDVGGDFQSIPLCRSKAQIGCALAYASFRADSPPPANSRFGKGRPGMKAACVNPAAPQGGDAPLHAYWNSGVNSVTGNSAAPLPWVEGGPVVTTPFVSTPGLVSAQCVSDEHGTYLAVTVHPSAGARVNTITGDVITAGAVQKDWGLHLIDANLAMGDLVDLVDAESKTYLAKR